MSAELLLGEGMLSARIPRGAGTTGMGPKCASEGRAPVADAGVFHERAFSLCPASPSARSSVRRSRTGLGVVCAHRVFQISFVNDGEIPLLPLRCKDETSWEEHQFSVSRLP